MAISDKINNLKFNSLGGTYKEPLKEILHDLDTEQKSKLEDIIEGENISMDKTDPNKPIISAKTNIVGAPQLFGINQTAIDTGTINLTLSSENTLAFVTLNGQVLQGDELSLSGNILTVTTDKFYSLSDKIMVFQNQSATVEPFSQINADWNSTGGVSQILNKPSTFTPSVHTHLISEIAGLQLALDDKIGNDRVGVSGGVAGLDVNGYVPSYNLPPLAITEYLDNFIDLTAALADTDVQNSQRGDWFTVDTDGGASYIVINDNPTEANDVKKLATPSSAIISVNGQIGTVLLTTDDVPESVNKYYSDTLARGAFSVNDPLIYNSTTGTFAIYKATGARGGYVSAEDWNIFNAKQDTLVSGTNVKTINGTSILGSGNLAINESLWTLAGGVYKYSDVVEIGNISASTPRLVLKGGAGGNDIITMERTGFKFGWSLASGGLAFRDLNTGNIGVNIFASSSGYSALYVGQADASYKITSNGLISAVTHSSSAGNNIPGTHLILQGGLGTGNATVGDIVFNTGNVGTSGNSPHSSSTKAILKGGTGNFGIGTNPTEKLHVNGNGIFTGTLKIGAYTLPSTDGTAGQVLKTNGAGVLYWANP